MLSLAKGLASTSCSIRQKGRYLLPARGRSLGRLTKVARLVGHNQFDRPFGGPREKPRKPPLLR